MFDFFIESIVWFFTEFGNYIFLKVSSLIFSVINNSNISTNNIWGVEYWNELNFFFPINEILSILTVLFGIWLAFFCVKIVLKLIPTIY